MTIHTMTPEQELVYLREQNAKYKAQAERQAKARISIKVSDKGGVSVYGLGRFPVTLYRSQWERLLAMTPDIVDFIETNAHLLASKE